METPGPSPPPAAWAEGDAATGGAASDAAGENETGDIRRNSKVETLIGDAAASGGTTTIVVRVDAESTAGDRQVGAHGADAGPAGPSGAHAAGASRTTPADGCRSASETNRGTRRKEEESVKHLPTGVHLSKQRNPSANRLEAFDTKQFSSTDGRLYTNCSNSGGGGGGGGGGDDGGDSAVNRSKKKKVSLVLLNRERRREKETQRREILDNESFTVYRKASDGSITSSVAAFRRKQFESPSQREHYFQAKMIRSLESARQLQQERLQRFFHDIDQNGEWDGP